MKNTLNKINETIINSKKLSIYKVLWYGFNIVPERSNPTTGENSNVYPTATLFSSHEIRLSVHTTYGVRRKNKLENNYEINCN